jgi:glyoxylase-like metal-dependent hydrolase (beta-lactamase superfamily II)
VDTTPAVPLGHDVYELDTRMSGYEGITAAYAILGERPCLIETGTAASAPVVAAALEGLGVGPDDLALIVVTHIHLDHAGGVGDLARRYPRARVVVHERGARHLADPERLLASARLVFGRVLDDVFGLLAPTPAERIDAIGGYGEVDLGGGRLLRAHHAPGHASHHLGLVDSATGDLYVGDAAGIWIPQTRDLRPATPPPDFDLDLALDTLDRFRSYRPSRLLFSHFGPVTDVDEVLARSADELRLWVDLVREARVDGLDAEHTVTMVRARTAERYRAFTEDPQLVRKFEHLNADAANIAGILRALDRAASD